MRFRSIAVVAALGALMAAPAAASQGGEAAATGVSAVAAEVTLDVTASGAVAGLGPVVDRLTAGPALPGRRLNAVRAGTPPEPHGEVRDSLGPVDLGSVLVVEAVTAGTRREQDGDLSADAGVGGGRVDLFDLRVLDVGPVTSRVLTHPDEPPTATTSVSGLEVLGSPVVLPEGQEVDLSLALSTDQVLALLESLAPGLSSATGLLARVAGAGGAVDVTVRSERSADASTGAASATGLVAEVELRLDARLCVPELRGAGCVGEVAVGADARVLDLRLAQSAVRRPVADESTGVEPWVLALAGLGLTLLVVVLISARAGAAARRP